MNVGLLIIGDEILSGRRQDAHLTQLIALLSERGMRLSWAQYVGDEPARITTVLKAAMNSGDLVFSCGGIGATPDDHTRQCAAWAWAQPLVPHAQAQALIMARIQAQAVEQGWATDPDHPDNVRRLDMGVLPQGASLVPNAYNQIPGFSMGSVYCLPGFPVMAWPMMAWVLDTQYAHLHGTDCSMERSVVVYGAMEASLTPLMVEIEARFPLVKIFSLPSVDHPVHGRHIDLGVKGTEEVVDKAYAALLEGLRALGVRLGPESVR